MGRAQRRAANAQKRLAEPVAQKVQYCQKSGSVDVKVGQSNGKRSRRSGSRSVYLTFFREGRCEFCGRLVKSLTASMGQRHLRRNHPLELARALEPRLRGAGEWGGGGGGGGGTDLLQLLHLPGLLERAWDDTASTSSAASPPQPAASPDLAAIFPAGPLLAADSEGMAAEPDLLLALHNLTHRLHHDSMAQELAQHNDVQAARQLVVDLMNGFYRLGWMFGSGGAMCIRSRLADRQLIFATPSAVQKDRLALDDIGILDESGEVLVQPTEPNTVSSCIKLFQTIFATHDAQAHAHAALNCVIHSHSVEANLIGTVPDRAYNKVRFGPEEMLKGVVKRAEARPYNNVECCEIPVIANAPSEGSPEFAIRIKEAMTAFPNASAILVRNHGAFYFGRDWKETKIMAEIFEYLFKLTLEKVKLVPKLADDIFVSDDHSE